MAQKKVEFVVTEKGAGKARKGFQGVDVQLKSMAKNALALGGILMVVKKSLDFAVELKNLARDAEETTNKFNTVFSSMGEVAVKTSRTLADSFGLAHTTAMELLGDTGDILVGFGFTEDAALELSDKVNRLAVDLASFTNFEGGAARASDALTKAILGETESAKALGIVLRQGTQEFRDNVKQLQENEGMTYNQAMATTLLEDAYRQSEKAIGDFARTQDDLANKERILSEEFKALKENLGTQLTPAFHEMASNTIDAAGAVSLFFQELSETTLETVTRQLREMGAAAEDIALLQNLIDIESQTETLLSTNDKLKAKFIELSGVHDEMLGMQSESAILTKEQLVNLGAIVQFELDENSIRQRYVELKNAELLTEEKIRGEIQKVKEENAELLKIHKETGKLKAEEVEKNAEEIALDRKSVV